MVKLLAAEMVQDIEIACAFDKPGPYFLNRPKTYNAFEGGLGRSHCFTMFSMI